MKLAVPYDTVSGEVFRIFEKTPVLKIYTVEDGEIYSSEMVGTMAESVQDIIDLMQMLETDGLLCGDMDESTRQLLHNEGVVFYSGFYEKADEAVQDFLDGLILFGPDD